MEFLVVFLRWDFRPERMNLDDLDIKEAKKAVKFTAFLDAVVDLP